MLNKIFEDIYRTNGWQNTETVSGCGSTVDWTERIRQEIPFLLRDLNIQTILDAGCGDWNWMSKIDFGERRVYACDIVGDLINQNRRKYCEKAVFFPVDITKGQLFDVDLIICRTVLFHLSLEHVKQALENMTRNCQYLLLTTHPQVLVNPDAEDGDFRRLNMSIDPFNLGKPQLLIQDGPTEDGFLGLWRTHVTR